MTFLRSPLRNHLSLRLIFLSLCFLLLNTNKSSAQKTSKTDSLRQILNSPGTADSVRLFTLNNLSLECRKAGKYDSAIYFSQEAILQASSMLNDKEASQRKIFLAKKGMGNAYNIRGVAFHIQGNYPEALRNLFEALKLRESIGDKNGIAASLSNIGLVYDNQGDFKKALVNHEQALKINLQSGNKEYTAFNYNNIGNIYYDLNNFKAAENNYAAALELMKVLNNENGIASCYNNLGLINETQGKFDEAIKNYNAALQIKTKDQDRQGLAIANTNLGSVYVKTGKLKEAASYFEKGERYSKETGNLGVLTDCYLGMTQLDSATGNWKAAFLHHKLYIAYRDSVTNEENTTKSVQATMNYEFGKKEALANAEHEKKMNESEEKTKKQKLYFLISCLFVVAIGAFSTVLFRSLRVTRKQKLIIEEEKKKTDIAYEHLDRKNKEVLDSIYYARRIQQALLSSEKYMERKLKSQKKKS